MFLKILAIALLMDLAAYGQSLGDVARENRDKKKTEDDRRPCCWPPRSPPTVPRLALGSRPDSSEGPRL